MKKIVLVGAYPPSKEGLNEYNRELAKGICSLGYNVTVLANALSPMESRSPQPEDKGITVKRAWKCESITSGARIIRALYSEKPDLVIFGLLFTTFGFNPIVSFINLLAPVICRLLGFRTHVVLHHIYERIDMSRYGKGTDLVKRVETVGLHPADDGDAVGAGDDLDADAAIPAADGEGAHDATSNPPGAATRRRRISPRPSSPLRTISSDAAKACPCLQQPHGSGLTMPFSVSALTTRSLGTTLFVFTNGPPSWPALARRPSC